MRFLNVLFVLFFASGCATAQEPGGGPIIPCPVAYSCTDGDCTPQSGAPQYYAPKMISGAGNGGYVLYSTAFKLEYKRPSASCKYYSKNPNEHGYVVAYGKPEYINIRPNFSSGGGGWTGTMDNAQCTATNAVGCDFYLEDHIP